MYSIQRTATARVLRVLSEGPRNISEIARKSELAFSYMFRLLPEMERDELVVSEKKGKEKIYQLTNYGTDVYNVLYRRRLLEAGKPQVQSLEEKVPQEILTRSGAISNEFSEFLKDTMRLRIFTSKDITTLKRAKEVLDKSARSKKDASG